MRPANASIVWERAASSWRDGNWMTVRAERNRRDAAISIYEVHLGSWRRDESYHWLTYRELAEQLLPYVRDMGFTHV